MAQQPQQSPQEVVNEDSEPQVVRFRMPAPFGTLAMELTDGRVTQVLLNAKKAKLKAFPSFDEVDEVTEELEELFGRISEYFAGVRRRLDLNWDLESTGVTGLARRIFKETTKIPFGRTRTYREIAVAAGQPDAYRVVLATLVDNPLPIVIPCHRVTTNKSGIGSYVAGKKVKRWLIDMEKRALKERTVG
jgi:methylated-DNA-[protein]-cysteine S-methyltransferase